MKKALGFLICLMLFVGIMTAVSAQSSAEALQTRIAEVEAAIERLQLEIERMVADGKLSEPKSVTINPELLNRMNDVIATSKGEVTLTDARITSQNELEFTIKINNNTESDVTLYESYFNVRNADGWMLDGTLSCTDGLSEPIGIGEEASRDLCYKLEGSAPFRFYFQAAQFDNEVVVWEITD